MTSKPRTHKHRYVWGSPEWLTKHGTEPKGIQPPEPYEVCRCGAHRPTSLTLPAISTDIKKAWTEARLHQVAALEGYLRVGHLLDEARRQLPANADYGAWFDAQEFGFSRQWAVRLRQLARNEDEVRSLSATAVSDGSNAPGVNRLLELLSGRPEPLTSAVSDIIETIVAGILAQPVPTTIRIPATIEGAVTRLTELDEETRRLHAARAYLQALLPNEDQP